jgi:membrane complex biogenesis BtpA family protein
MPVLPPRALIGMVHIRALPGSPFASQPLDAIIRTAVAEAAALKDCGFDALILENMHDRPYINAPHPPHTTACMTAVALAVREAVGELPIGVQVLSGGEHEALAVALACRGSFIRCENFVFAHVADEGLMPQAAAGPLLRYRKSLNAGAAIFADIKKKHASHALTADISLADAAKAAEFFGADGVIVTGTATGEPTDPAHVAEVRAATTPTLPVLVGSGVTPQQVRPLFDAGADGLIVGSSIKQGGLWSNPLDPTACRALAAAR